MRADRERIVHFPYKKKGIRSSNNHFPKMTRHIPPIPVITAFLLLIPSQPPVPWPNSLLLSHLHPPRTLGAHKQGVRGI